MEAGFFICVRKIQTDIFFWIILAGNKLPILIPIKELYKTFLLHPVVCTDTRLLSPGCLFFALKGENFNGNKFAAKSLEGGAAFAVVDEKEFVVNDQCLLVDDVLQSLQQLATHHRNQLNIPVIAITGSNGKTTTKELTAVVLSRKYKTLFTKGNLNNHIGVPLTLLSITADHQIAVVEMGANHQKEIEALCLIAQPDYGLITNIGKAHLEGFGGFEGVKKGKGELYQYIKSVAGLIFINGDNSFLNELLAGYDNVCTYGTTFSNDVAGEGELNGSFLSVNLMSPFKAKIKTQVTGIYNFENVMSAIAVGIYFKVEPEEIKSAIENYVPSNQRSQVVKKANNVTLVMDAYNANPSSIMAALDNFSYAFSGDKIVALGDMLELGIESEQEHKMIVDDLLKRNFTQVILVGPQFESAAKNSGLLLFANSTDAAQWLILNPVKNSSILIKGSRGIKMELIADAID